MITHKLSMYETVGYLRDYLDNCNVIPLQLSDEYKLIENHCRLLLLNELERSNDIRLIMSDLLPTIQADEIGDSIHDMILNDLKLYIQLDEDERIVNINISDDGDLTLEIEDFNVLRASGY